MRTKFTALAVLVALASLTCLAIAADDAKKSAPPAGVPEMKLPPGWTMEDMQACVLAGTPGKMQELLAKDVGNWKAKSTMWMAPGADALKSDGTMVVSSVMDGRYIKTVMKGDIPGMGPYTGEGMTGFDNVSQEFVSTWIDNHSTGMMIGTGKLSDDKKTLTWKFTFNCPLTKKPVAMRQIDTDTGAKTKTIEMYSTDPKTGKEYKMMVCEMTKE